MTGRLIRPPRRNEPAYLGGAIIWCIVEDHTAPGGTYTLDDMEAMVIAQDVLTEADLEPYKGNQAVWQHHLRAEVHRQKQSGGLLHVGRARYQRA